MVKYFQICIIFAELPDPELAKDPFSVTSRLYLIAFILSIPHLRNSMRDKTVSFFLGHNETIETFNSAQAMSSHVFVNAFTHICTPHLVRQSRIYMARTLEENIRMFSDVKLLVIVSTSETLPNAPDNQLKRFMLLDDTNSLVSEKAIDYNHAYLNSNEYKQTVEKAIVRETVESVEELNITARMHMIPESDLCLLSSLLEPNKNPPIRTPSTLANMPAGIAVEKDAQMRTTLRMLKKALAASTPTDTETDLRTRYNAFVEARVEMMTRLRKDDKYLHGTDFSLIARAKLNSVEILSAKQLDERVINSRFYILSKRARLDGPNLLNRFDLLDSRTFLDALLDRLDRG